MGLREKTFQQLVCDQAVREDLRGKSVKAAALTGSAGMVDFAVRLGSTAILARLVLPEHFGLIMMVTAVTAVADQLKDMGLSMATVQCREITHARATNLFWISVAVSLAIAFALCALSPLIAHFYRDPRLVSITCALAANFLFGGLMVQHQALLARQLKLGHTATVRLASSLLASAAAIGLAADGFGYWALVWREVLRSALMTAGMWVCFPWIPGLPSRRTGVRDTVRFGAHLTAANLIASATASADRLLLGRLWGATPVAVYRQAYQLLLVPMDQLLSPLYQVGQPGLSLLQSDGPRYRGFYRKLLGIVCLVTMPSSVFTAVYSRELTLLLLGPQWLECAPILLALSLVTFIRQPVSSAALLLVTRGRSRPYLQLTVIQQLTFFVFLCVGVQWGPRGVAFAEVAATYLLILPVLRICVHDSPLSLHDIFAVLGRTAGISLVTGAGLLLYRTFEPALPLPFILLLGGLVAAALFIVTWLVLPGGKTELANLAQDVFATIRKKNSVARPTDAPPPPANLVDRPLRHPAPVAPKA